MNIFQEVKARVTARQVAERYPLFAEALQNESKISYLADMLMFGTDEKIMVFFGTEGRR